MSEGEYDLDEDDDVLYSEDDYDEEDRGRLPLKQGFLILLIFGITLTFFIMVDVWFTGLKALNGESIMFPPILALIIGSMVAIAILAGAFQINTGKGMAWNMLFGYLIVWALLMLIILGYPSDYEARLEAKNKIIVVNLDSINAMLEYNTTMFIINFKDTGNYSIKLYSTYEDKCMAYDFYADGLNMSYNFDRTTLSNNMNDLKIENLDTGSLYTAHLNIYLGS